MLGLILQEEFRGRRLKGTAIALSNDSILLPSRLPLRRS